MPVCPVCGKSLEPLDHFCPHCGKQVRPEAGPLPNGSASPPAAPTGGPAFAGVGLRSVALVIDMLVLLTLFLLGGWFLTGTWVGITAKGWEVSGVPAFIFIIIMPLIYFTLLEGRYGQTVGKWLVSLKVIRQDGGPLDLRAAVVRNVLRLVDGLGGYLVGAILIWRSPHCQRLGDRVAQTLVVKTPTGPSAFS